MVETGIETCEKHMAHLLRTGCPPAAPKDNRLFIAIGLECLWKQHSKITAIHLDDNNKIKVQFTAQAPMWKTYVKHVKNMWKTCEKQ